MKSPVVNADGQVVIPAGTFIAGCDGGEVACPEFERPRRSLTLPAFKIDVFEVTERKHAHIATGAEHACRRLSSGRRLRGGRMGAYIPGAMSGT